MPTADTRPRRHRDRHAAGGLAAVTAGYLIAGPRPALSRPAARARSRFSSPLSRSSASAPADLARRGRDPHPPRPRRGSRRRRPGLSRREGLRARKRRPASRRPEQRSCDPRRWSTVRFSIRSSVVSTRRRANVCSCSVDDEEIDVGGGRSLRAIDSPGHAKHHLGLFDSASGLLFAGDAVGVRLARRGSTSAGYSCRRTSISTLALASLQKFADARPSAIALAHYGLVPIEPQELLDEAAATLRAWAEEAERAFRRRKGHRRGFRAPLRRGHCRPFARATASRRDTQRRSFECRRVATLARAAVGSL